jgi:predicted Zn-dependent protease
MAGRFGLRAASLLAAALAAAALLAAGPARAQGLLRDAESEAALRELARPLLAAAGIGADQIRVLIVNDRTLNAFVGDAQHILIHSGLILRVKRAEELQAVLAHEIAHIANGHITRRAANARSARTAAGLGLVLSAAAAAAGSGEAAAGLAAGTAGTAQRVFFGHTRAEEASADQSGIRYMAAAGIDPRAAAEVLELFRGQEALNIGRQDPYARTHPLSRERIRMIEGFAAGYADRARDDPAADWWFALVQGKLGAYLNNPAQTIRATRGQDGPLAHLRRAVAYHRMPKPAEAIVEAQALVAARPNDPYAHETLGWILLESRQTGAAVAAYRRAVALAPGEPLVLAGLGRALVAEGSPGALREALDVLERSRSRDPANPGVLRDLATALAKTGDPGMASVVTAERFALLGRLADARIHAERAQGQLPRGSRGWLRAEDILIAAEAAGNR